MKLKAISFRYLLAWTLFLIGIHYALVAYVSANGTMESLMAMHGTVLDAIIALSMIIARIMLFLFTAPFWIGWIVYRLLGKWTAPRSATSATV